MKSQDTKEDLLPDFGKAEFDIEHVSKIANASTNLKLFICSPRFPNRDFSEAKTSSGLQVNLLCFSLD